jgi:hypothetical protein
MMLKVNKTSPRKRERNEESCGHRSGVVVVPIVVEPVVVLAPLLVVPVKVTDVEVPIGVAVFIRDLIRITTLRILSGLNLIWYLQYSRVPYQVSSIF